MDDEKSISEKLTEAIGKAAHSVKSAVSHVIDTASEAAQHAMEANAEKIARIPAAKPDPEQVAGTTNEQFYIPAASDAAAMPMPLIPAAPVPPAKKKKKVAAKAITKKAARKPAKNAAKRSPGKKSKPSAGKTSAGNNSKKAVKTGGKNKR
jgi:membrane peptidoglycan carboxypeptidase